MITEALLSCRAPSVVVVLDCCFSGRAGIGPATAEPVFSWPAAQGAYLLASAERLALAPEDQQFTVFSGAFIDLLELGDPLGPQRITLDDAYAYLCRVLPGLGGPLPRRRATDRSGELVLTRNRAQPEQPEGPDQDDNLAPAGRSPYRGLAAFELEDADLFCGRDHLIGRLLDSTLLAAAESSPVVVVGPSGSGKSSLLRAGLLAGLRDGRPDPDTAGWP